MKKSILASALLLSAFSLSAKDFTVVQDGVMSPDVEYVYWWKGLMQFGQANPSGEGQVMAFKVEDATADGSCGLRTKSDNDFIGQLAGSTMTFDWYAATVGDKYEIRLAVDGGVQKDYILEVTEENAGKWNNVSFKVNEFSPEVAAGWKEYQKNGLGYVLGIHATNSKAESVLYLDNVIFKDLDETWEKPAVVELPAPTTVPVPTVDASKVKALFGSAYTPVINGFNIGAWSQSTQAQEMEIDGRKVMKVTFFNYLGWEFTPQNVSDCNMMHVDWFAANAGDFGFTPISGQEKPWKASEVKVGEWNSYDVPLTHWDNVDFTNIFQVKFDQGNGSQEGYIANVYFYKDENVKDPELGAHFYGNAEQTFSADGKEYTAEIAYELIANDDKTLTVNATVDGIDDVPGLVRQMHIYADQWPNFTQVEGNEYTLTSTGTFEPGFSFPDLFFHFPYQGGALRIDIPYVFGTANEKPATSIAPKLRNVAATDITATTANIAYTLVMPEELDGGSVDIFLDDKVVAINPEAGTVIELKDLSPLTEYTYTLKAVVSKDSEKYESKPVEVKFRTLRDGAQAAVYHAITDWMVPNAFLAGETEADKRSIPVSVEATLTYNPDQTMTVDATFHGNLPVGFVPAVTLRGKYDRKDMTLVEGKTYTATTTGITYEYGEDFDYLYFNIKYAGGETGNDPAIRGYKAGMENEPVAYGVPVSILMSLTKENLAVGDSALISAVAVDANGHYVFGHALEYSVDDASFKVEDNKVYAVGKGSATLTATCGEIYAAKTLNCVVSADAKNIVAYALTDEATNKATVVSNNDNWAFAFDNDENTQIDWTDQGQEPNLEHYVEITFEKNVGVECVELVWEGAAAKVYTVTLTPKADTSEVALLADDSLVPTVFTEENGQGGAGMVVRRQFVPENLQPVKAANIRLDIKQAATGWGVKLKEMRVLGSDNIGTGIETIDSENASVEYFNLQGVRVANPEGGIFIRRQGSKVEKVVL